ncbi:MAG: DEAD/DEAH box helicase [Planctomycetes bacterium]|nr:DEAD/DEAH box helicase [Planctomycetota bacterium]
MRLVFDRGTIVLDGVAPLNDALRAANVVWDPRVGSWRAPAWRYRDIVDALQRQRVDVEDLVAPTSRPETGPWETLELRPYQEAALFAWTANDRRGLIVLPTGSGKTRVAVAAMATTRRPTLCLAPTRVLLHQWRDEVARAYGGRVGCLGDGEHVLAPVTIATVESAYRHMARIGNQFELLIVDEAHHFGAGVRDEALEMSTAPARLGLTATPLPPGPGATRFEALVGPTVYQLGVRDLAGRCLADFDVAVLLLDLTPDERRLYESERRAYQLAFSRFREMAPTGTWGDFIATASRTVEGRRAIAAWHRARRLLAYTTAKAAAVANLLERHRDHRVLVFTAHNETAYAISRTHLVMPLTCDIGKAERDDALDRFRRGELRTLVSARVLNEGFDVPEADVAIVVGGSLGEREHVQRVGRLLRPSAGKRAIVYELVTRRSSEVRTGERRRRGLDSSRGHSRP